MLKNCNVCEDSEFFINFALQKRINEIMNRILFYIPVFFVVFSLCSCGEDRTYQYEEKTQHNHWVYDVMLDEYLWADRLSDYTPDWKSFFAAPSSFLSTLVAKSGHSDVWSYVEIDTLVADIHERGQFNHIDSYGMDYVLMTDPTGQTTKQVLRLMTVYPNSPAEAAGLRRNDFITSLDGYRISSSNMSRLKSGGSHSLEVTHIAVDEAENFFYWSDTTAVALGASGYVEDEAFPIYNIMYIEGMKVGYVMCTRLVEYAVERGVGRGNGAEYCEKLDEVMAYMQGGGVDEMVLDLRLCNYGTLAMAQRLASYVVNPNCRSGAFAKTFRNEAHSAENAVLPYDFSVGNLGLSRVYVLTSAYTQGAAEWVIHALKCSMGEENVITVGLATKGQNVMTEEVGLNFHVRLFPVVAYVADGEGNYDYGSIAPTINVNEQNYVSMGEYGTLDDILYYTAVADMLGIGQDDRENAENDDNMTE